MDKCYCCGSSSELCKVNLKKWSRTKVLKCAKCRLEPMLLSEFGITYEEFMIEVENG